MAPAKFAFVDEGEALRRLNVDRDTLLAFVAQGRIKAHGVGIHHYYRTKDVEALYAELYGNTAALEPAATRSPTGAKLFDPAYKVHVRLQADLKWYDLGDDDLRAWVREMTADGYPRQRANVQMVMGKLQRLVELMDEAAAGWQVLKPAHQIAQGPETERPADATSEATGAKPASRRGKPLAMFSGAPGQTPAPAPSQPAPLAQSAPSAPDAPITPTRRGKPLPLAGAPRPAETAGPQPKQ